MNEYSCESCMNGGTPLCEGCNNITSPSGRQRRPSRFVGGTGINKTAKRCVALASSISMRAMGGDPIPLLWVMEYNRLITDEGEG